MSRNLLKAFQGLRIFAFSFAIMAMLAALVPAPSFAAGGQTGNLSGTVIDASTNAGLPNVTVNAVSPSGSYKTTTDSKGFFSILGMVVDTYSVSFEFQGYNFSAITGVTIPGDQNLNIGNVRGSKVLKTIGTVKATATSAYQPGQTTDSYTVSGNRILESVGKTDGTNENSIILAVPGVSLTNGGTPTIRGGDPTEVGYQLDGVDFSEPFLRMNGSLGRVNGIGSVQVVEGSGDATQGDVGAGVINVIPKRGTNPATGEIDFETGGPNFSHQFAINYGFATPNGRISDYFSFTGQRFDPYYGYHLTNVQNYGNGLNTGYQVENQFVNNFVFKFGHNNNQSLQALYSNQDLEGFGDAGGLLNEQAYYLYSPYADSAFIGGTLAKLYGTAGTNAFSSIYPLLPYTPANSASPITEAEQTATVETRFLKFEYDNNLDANTYLALKYYNWEQLQTADQEYNIPAQSTGVYQSLGGPTTGGTLDITRQIGTKLTVSLNGTYEVLRPIWNLDEPFEGFFGPGFLGTPGSSPNYGDWLPASATCKTCGYLTSYFPNGVPRLPDWGINYNGSFFQKYGAGIRLQYAPTNRLKFDLGVRNEQQYQHFINEGYDQYNPEPNNPFDVVENQFTNTQLDPHVTQPRGSVSYQMGPNDSLRAGYGRSAVFEDAQTTGTPFGPSGLTPYNRIPAKPGALCGLATFGGTFKCANYAEQLYWQGDAVEAPDGGGGTPAIYSNYDFTYQHRFQNGWATHLTPFYKLGTTLPAASLLNTLPNGQQIFEIQGKGFNRTTGLEFELTTAEKPVGFSGFFSATYQNVLQSAPPLSNGEDTVPQLSPATLALGNAYRAGYVSPFSARLGGTYHFKTGLSITPVLQYDRGYPYNIGNLIAAQLGANSFANVTQVNFGPGITPIVGYQNSSGAAQATNFFDPAFPGTVLNPNIAATRGTPSTPSNGGALWKPNLTANVTAEYKLGRNVVGLQVANLLGNAYNGSIPLINPYYQPVATGLSGPLTGVNTLTPTYGVSRAGTNLPRDAYAFSNGAYLLSNGSGILAPLTPTTFTLYYQYKL